jgi:hypothetical protein
MAEPGNFTFRERWWEQIENDPEVGEGLLAAALVISHAARRDGTRALMSRRQLAEKLVVSEATAKRRTQRLRELGYLRLVEQGRRRGDGTVTANVYDLSQRVTQMTHRDSAEEGEPEFSTGQTGVSTGQNGASMGHPGDPPLFTPPINSPKVKRPPASAAGGRHTYKDDWRAKDLERLRAVVAEENDMLIFLAADIYDAVAELGKDWPGLYIAEIAQRGGVSEFLASLGFDQWAGDDVKQDQKRLEEEPRCAVHACGATESNHERWLALSGEQPHPFVKASS